MASNVEQAVARRGQSVEAYVKGAAQWYSQLVPSHMDAGQYQALLLNMLRRNAKLMAAAEANPHSFRAAANECARLGLVPGSTAHFVPFENRRQQTWEISLIVDWKGEVENIYKANPDVIAVECEVVRTGGPKADYFRRPRPGRPYPEHEIADEGMATAEERGTLAGVYAYCRYRDGSVSTCVVLARDEVAKHRAKAKTFDFWGPEWPKESDWTPNMWRKTAIHVLYDLVPRSAEYQQNLIRTAALIQRQDQPSPLIIPPAEQPAQPALVPGRRMLTPGFADETPAAGDDTTTASRPLVAQGNGTDEPGPSGQVKGDERRQAPRAARPANSRGAQPPPPQDKPAPDGTSSPPSGAGPAARKDVVKITTRLDDMPLGTPADVAEALSWLAGRPITGPEDLTQPEADAVWERLNDLLSRAGDGGPGMAASLLWEDIGKDQGREDPDEYPAS